MRRPIHKGARVERHTLDDRPLLSIGPESKAWTGFHTEGPIQAGTILWLKPPPSATAEYVAAFVQKLKDQGVHVKLLPPDRADADVVEARPELASVMSASDSREVVYQMCRELAGPAGVSAEAVIEAVEPFLARVGL